MILDLDEMCMDDAKCHEIYDNFDSDNSGKHAVPF